MLDKKIMQKSQIGVNKNNKDKSYSKMTELMKTDFFGVGVTNNTKENILEYIVNSLKKGKEKYYIVTPNPEIIVTSTKNLDLKNALNNAKIASADGVGLILAGKILGKNLKERLTGIEILEEVCKRVADWPIRVGFLGGGPKIAEKTSECLRLKYPGLKIGFVGQEWPNGLHNKNSKEFSTNHRSQTNILFVAFGAPKQELWMQSHINKIPVNVMVGVGGSFDQIVNESLRPPKVLDRLGLGWLYRLVRQPWRIKRQLSLIEFVWMIIKEKLS